MSFIGSFAQGDWSKGLVEMATGGAGGGMFDVIRGRQSFGEYAAETGKRVAIEAPIAIASMGLGSIAGAAASGLSKVAQAATEGSKIANVASKAAQGLTTVSTKLGTVQGAVNSVKNYTQGVTAGPAASITDSASGSLLKIGTKSPATADSLASKIGANAPAPASQTMFQGAKGAIPNAKGIQYTIPNQAVTAAKGSTGIVSAMKSKAGQAVTQYGVQGLLSLASAGMAAKQANAANEVSRQSLLFQQQTYQEQKAEREKTKAQIKSEAGKAYESSLLFGEKLQQDNPSSANLFTGYNTDGTGNAGIYSILSGGNISKKMSDLT